MLMTDNCCFRAYVKGVFVRKVLYMFRTVPNIMFDVAKAVIAEINQDHLLVSY